MVLLDGRISAVNSKIKAIKNLIMAADPEEWANWNMKGVVGPSSICNSPHIDGIEFISTSGAK